ncbi:hypothetical protein B0O99DRAFT_598224 [Bisporella sp. PMI_857]|nr:hypothetical protein B0O99DRAFT_598224 [Bisporella sp. PMI_857]
MTVSPRCSQLLKVLLPFVFLLLVVGFFFSPSNPITPPTNWSKPTTGDSTKPERPESKETTTDEPPPTINVPVQGPVNTDGAAPFKKASFIQDAADWEIDGQYDDSPLRELCSKTKWQPGLIFKCEAAYGGIGNVRNTVLTCVRYAIEAGATALLVPQITVRGDTDLADLKTGKMLPFTYMLDEHHFTTSLLAACPKMRLISHEDDLADMPSILNPSKIKPIQLSTDIRLGRVIKYAKEWRSIFDKWLKDYGAPNGFSASSPLLVSVAPSFFEYSIHSDSPKFIATFGRIIRFNEETRHLAATVLYAMDKKYKMNLNASHTGIPQVEKFYGAHLRTDSDAEKAGFAPYSEQSKAYLAAAHAAKLSVAYVASGSPSDTERFTKEAGEQGISVTTKYALLESDPEYANALARMKALTWDQQALIDYAILLRSSIFGGTWASSFGWNIVFKRHVAVGNGVWVPSEAAKKEMGIKRRRRRGGDQQEPPNECYRDSISTVFGWDGAGIWFEVSMWP